MFAAGPDGIRRPTPTQCDRQQSPDRTDEIGGRIQPVTLIEGGKLQPLVVQRWVSLQKNGKFGLRPVQRSGQGHSAFLALIAAGLTILVLVRQIRQSDRQHKLERQKKMEAARAVMPLAISRLVDYASSALQYSLIGKSRISNRETHDHELPHIPGDVVSVLREVIEYGDDGQTGQALRKLISEVQYHHARLLDLPRQETTLLKKKERPLEMSPTTFL